MLEPVTAIVIAAVSAMQVESAGHAEALRLAQAGQYDAALALLSGAEGRDDYETRLLRARILSWSGRHAEAAQAIAELQSAHPGNAEVLTLRASLSYYQGALEDAERQARQALAVSPGFQDAHQLLERIERARSNEPGRSYLRADAGYERSSFERSNNEDWWSGFAQLTWIASNYAIGVRREEFERFGLRNAQTGIRASYTVSPDWTVNLQADYGPDNIYRPEQSVGLSLQRRWRPTAEADTYVYGGLSYKHDAYAALDVSEVYAEAGFRKPHYGLMGRVLTVNDPDSDATIGLVLRGEYDLNSRVRAVIGVADAPETEAGTTVRTRSVSAGVLLQVTPRSQMRFDCTRDDREAAYIRNACSVSFSRTF